MRPNDSYRSDLLLAWVFRLGLYLGIGAILATTLGNCSPLPKTSDILPSMSAVTLPVRGAGEEARTRNDTPTNGGCHEKSDLTPREPLR
jgi:hypothetical protein